MVTRINGVEVVVKKSSIGWSQTIDRTHTKRPYAVFVNDRPSVDAMGRIRTFSNLRAAIRAVRTQGK